jgi:RHS repeat-associated protein
LLRLHVRSRSTGKERDAETNLDYFGARYFSGAQGRFTSADAPFADQEADLPESWNMYTYGRNNPLRYVDPDGRESHAEESGAFSSYAGVLMIEPKPVPKPQQPQPDPPSGLGQFDQFLYGVVFGHHGLSEWRKIPGDSAAYRFFSRWYTGPLKDNTANYYDKLHRSLNSSLRRMVDDFLQETGKKSLSELGKEEIKALARRVLASNEPGVRDFLNRLEGLNPGSVGTLFGLIDTIDFGSGFVFLVPGQQILMDLRQCGHSPCGGQIF